MRSPVPQGPNSMPKHILQPSLQQPGQCYHTIDLMSMIDVIRGEGPLYELSWYCCMSHSKLQTRCLPSMTACGVVCRHVRKAAVQLLSTAAHNKPGLIVDHLASVLPLLYDQTTLNPALVRYDLPNTLCKLHASAYKRMTWHGNSSLYMQQSPSSPQQDPQQ